MRGPAQGHPEPEPGAGPLSANLRRPPAGPAALAAVHSCALCQQAGPAAGQPLFVVWATEALTGAGLGAGEMFIRLSEKQSMWVSHPVGPAFPQPPTPNKSGASICLSD